MSSTSNDLMSQLPQRPWVRTLSLVLALLLGACTTLHPMPIEILGPEPHPSPVRVTTDDGREVVWDARILGDTLLTGVLRGAAISPFPSVSLDQVASIEESWVNPGRTTALLLGTILLVLAAMTSPYR